MIQLPDRTSLRNDGTIEGGIPLGLPKGVELTGRIGMETSCMGTYQRSFWACGLSLSRASSAGCIGGPAVRGSFGLSCRGFIWNREPYSELLDARFLQASILACQRLYDSPLRFA